ncbi:hypothetical protein STRDD11_02062 [Streptococcus sp. DD11]|nr:hypothetical protein STRDD11_02062 [Streptococcus sp. DD11]
MTGRNYPPDSFTTKSKLKDYKGFVIQFLNNLKGIVYEKVDGGETKSFLV